MVVCLPWQGEGGYDAEEFAEILLDRNYDIYSAIYDVVPVPKCEDLISATVELFHSRTPNTSGGGGRGVMARGESLVRCWSDNVARTCRVSAASSFCVAALAK